MIDASALYSQHGVEITNKSNGELIGTCPFCDKEGHFYIEKESGLYYCQRCKEGGNLYQFLQWKGMSKKDAAKELENCRLWDDKRTHSGTHQHKQAAFNDHQVRIQEHPGIDRYGGRNGFDAGRARRFDAAGTRDIGRRDGARTDAGVLDRVRADDDAGVFAR